MISPRSRLVPAAGASLPEVERYPYHTGRNDSVHEGAQDQLLERVAGIRGKNGVAARSASLYAIRPPNLQSFSGVRRARLEGPNGRRAAQPINRLVLPVKRFVFQNSHGDVLSQDSLQRCHGFSKCATGIDRKSVDICSPAYAGVRRRFWEGEVGVGKGLSDMLPELEETKSLSGNSDRLDSGG
jgi:hypothetical protein